MKCKKPDLIYCASGNRDFARIAIKYGFLYGGQLPNKVHFSPYFADQDWKSPNRIKYIDSLKNHKPTLATVLDWETQDQLPDVLGWAEDAAQFVKIVIIIPKVLGGIRQLPRIIGGKSVRLGYSVPTKYGGTSIPFTEFYGWPIHLLGGSPQKQLGLTRFLDVHSADGNMSQMMAVRYCSFWVADKKRYKGHWPKISEVDGKKWGDGSKTANAPYEAFRRSCKNIMGAWDRYTQAPQLLQG